MKIFNYWLVSDKSKAQKKDNDKNKEEPSSFFQRKRVDMLLGELLNKFPLPLLPQHQQQTGQNQALTATTQAATQNAAAKTDAAQDAQSTVESAAGGLEIKQELMDASSPPSAIGNGAQQQDDMLSGSIKSEPNHMKPPPEKKMKL